MKSARRTSQAEPVMVEAAIGRRRWVKDTDAKKCMACYCKFSLLLRKHHCRLCGLVFCHACSSHVIKLKTSGRTGRACNACFERAKNGQLKIAGGYSVEPSLTREEDTRFEQYPEEQNLFHDQEEEEDDTSQCTPRKASLLTHDSPLRSPRPEAEEISPQQKRYLVALSAQHKQHHRDLLVQKISDSEGSSGHIPPCDEWDIFQSGPAAAAYSDSKQLPTASVRASPVLTLGSECPQLGFLSVHPTASDSFLILLSVLLYLGLNSFGSCVVAWSFVVLFWQRLHVHAYSAAKQAR
eukprot:g57235.t1